MKNYVLIALLLLSPQQLLAASQTVLDRVMVVGSASNLEDIPGSASYVDANKGEASHYTDINRVLRQVPGVNLQEEEGYGNRPNIGMRGSRSERSANITLMEDGVLIAPAPYAAPSAYYFPRVNRMHAVEVRKGSSTIKFGPRTTSGVVNLISSPIPEHDAAELSIAGGSDDAVQAGIFAGIKRSFFGAVVDYTHDKTNGFKESDSGEDTGYDIRDFMGKAQIHSNPQNDVYHSFELKIGATREDSNETYLGLTDMDFSANPLRRYKAAQRDNMDAEHEQYQLQYYVEPADGIDVTTTLYRNDFHRNWYKLQSVTDGTSSLSLNSALTSTPHLAILRGDINSAPGALTVRANNRTYESYGIQSVVGIAFNPGNIDNQMEIGVRYHMDEEDRFQHEDTYQMLSGSMVLSSAGAAGSNANRIGSADALAVFVQDTIKVGDVTLVPGVRYETIDMKREDYGKSDPMRTGASLKTFTRNVDQVVPGIGASYDHNDYLSFFGGVHKGFAPPAPPSSATDTTQNEESVNYEAGVRLKGNNVAFELLGYYNDYSNLLGTDTLSSGNAGGTGMQFNSGDVNVMGIEASVASDLARLFTHSPVNIPVSLNLTTTDAEFQSSFISGFSEWGTVTKGDKLPYIPEIQLYASIGAVADRWSGFVSAKYVDEMRTVAGQGSIPSTLKTDAHFIVDLTGEVEIMHNTWFFASIDNLFDKEYIAARRPAGARPGKPRTILAGLKVMLP